MRSPSLLLLPVIFPILIISNQLKERKKLKIQLHVLTTLSEIFENEFGDIEKRGTKESVSFWGQVKSSVELEDLLLLK
ncbi:MAG: hypothetical protein GY855_09495 [candidate division Zixibacteria bacterium]|nr:hypothetical protein [candidate division Zixibacteria bacterium]